MAVQALNVPPAPTAQTGVQGSRPAQPTLQELLAPREEDQVNVSQEAQDRAKVEEAQLEEQRQAEGVQQGTTEQANQEAARQTALYLDRARVDLLA
jgi:hypothetical protein